MGCSGKIGCRVNNRQINQPHAMNIDARIARRKKVEQNEQNLGGSDIRHGSDRSWRVFAMGQELGSTRSYSRRA